MSMKNKASVLAVGTAVPPNIVYQSDYPDYYFRITKSEHRVDLKDKLARMCIGSNIEKRHFYITEKMLEDHPNLITHDERSLDTRNKFLAPMVAELAKNAAEKALKEWGQPRSKITHIIFHTFSGCVTVPGPDAEMIKLLGLDPTVKRYMFYYNGCYTGGAIFRVAKDLAENNPGARVLAICSECTLSLFRGPSENAIDLLSAQAMFGDGAGAVIIGSNPDLAVEKPLYEILSADQALIPGTEGIICGHVAEAGFVSHLSKDVHVHLSNNISKCVTGALSPLGITDLNSLFWILHPGAPKIMSAIEAKLNLDNDKLFASRRVLAEFGNVLSGSVIFAMDVMRKKSMEEGKATTGDGAEFGLLMGLGPGLTIETIVLRALASLI